MVPSTSSCPPLSSCDHCAVRHPFLTRVSLCPSAFSPGLSFSLGAGNRIPARVKLFRFSDGGSRDYANPYYRVDPGYRSKSASPPALAPITSTTTTDYRSITRLRRLINFKSSSMVKSKGDRQSPCIDHRGRSNGRPVDQSEAEQAITHLKDIFGKEIEHQIIEDVFNTLDCDYNAALENLLSMTGMIEDVSPGIEKLNLQHHSPQQREWVVADSVVISKGAAAAAAPAHAPVPTSSSGSVPKGSPSHAMTWTAMLNANAVPFLPVIEKPKAKVRTNPIINDLDPELERKLTQLQHPGTRIMLLMRGLPGSGKSVMADHVARRFEGQIVSADDFFMRSGYYQFEPDFLKEAHTRAQEKAEAWVKLKTKLIIVDNTNLEDWEMMPYARIAEKNGYRLVFAEPKTAWKYTPSTLAQKNTHGVTAKSIERMLNKFDRAVTAEKLISRIKADNTYRQFMSPVPSQNAPAAASAAPLHPASSSASASLPCLMNERRSHSTASFTAPSSNGTRAVPNNMEEMDMEISPAASDDDIVEVPVSEDATSDLLSFPRTVRERIAAGARICADESSNWQMPVFPVEKRRVTEVQNAVVLVRDSSSQTAVNDFAKVQLGVDWSFDLDEDGDEAEIDQSIGNEYRHTARSPGSVRMDKSTTIENGELGGLSVEEKIELLMREFPLATRKYIREVLVCCHECHELARNVLLGFDDDQFEDEFMTQNDEGEEEIAVDSDPERNDQAAAASSSDLTLELNLNLAVALEAKFGPISGEPFRHLSFNLDECLARAIYDSWSRATQPHASHSQAKPVPQAKPGNKKVKGATGGTLFAAAPTCLFEEIQHQQEAEERSRQEMRNTDRSDEQRIQDAKRQHLYSMFPGAPADVLDSVLEANNFDAVEAGVQIRAMTKQWGHDNEVQYLNALKSKAKKSFPPASECGPKDLQVPLDVPPSKRLMAKSLPDLRDEMLTLYKLKHRLVEQARKCCSSKQYMVTAYYRQEADLIDKRIEKLAQTIVVKTLEVQGHGNVLDLHFLHVREALCVLKFFMKLKRQQMKDSGTQNTVVDVITGHGASGTVPKIKPAVEEYLKSNKIAYTNRNAGCFMVALTQRGRK